MSNYKKLINKWRSILRIETIPLSIMSVALGSILGIHYVSIDILVCSLACCTAACLQILCNIANDYGDFVTGADVINKVKSPNAIHVSIISKEGAKMLIILFSLLSMIFGVFTLKYANLSLSEVYVFLLIGGISIIASITYTVGNCAYGYRRLGDISVLLFFGFIGVNGGFYLQSHQWNFSAMVLSVCYGSLVMGVLNINNVRDIETDILAAKHTLASWLGREKAILFQKLLSCIHILSCSWYTLLLYKNVAYILLYLPSFLGFQFIAFRMTYASPIDMNYLLKKQVLWTIIFSVVSISISIYLKSTTSILG